MQYAEMAPGAVIDAGSYRVTEEEILRFATEWDPQPFHVDRDAAAQSRWGGLIASGWHTCVIAMKLAVSGVLAGSESIGSPGIDELRWEAPVRPGDELRLRLSVLSSRRSSSGEFGIVRWQWEMTNQAGVRVLSLIATSLFGLATPAPASRGGRSHRPGGR
jgi:acyl dehydratase